MYSSFPSFADWQRHANGHEAFDAAARDFAALRADAKQKARQKAAREISMETNAIEGVFATDRGFTRTVALELQGWEDEMESRGDHVRPAFEDSLNGYELALDLATGRVPMTQLAISELHSRMTASQPDHRVRTAAGWQNRELPHGQYKQYPNNPTRHDGTVHDYAAPEDVQAEMTKLIDEISTEEFAQAHPVEQASYIHFAFVVIHPFADGNGRVSRALAGVYLLREPGIPFVMFNDQREAYLDALERADTGNYRPFIDFVEQRTIDALRLAVEQFGVQSGSVGAADMLSQLGHTDDEVAGDRLMDAVYTTLEKRFEELEAPPQLDFTVSRAVTTEINVVCLGAKPGFPVTGRVRLAVEEHLRVVADAPARSYEPYRDLVVERRSVHPVIDESTRRRIEAWAQNYVNHFVAVVVQRYRAG